MSSASMLTFLPAGDSLPTKPFGQSQSQNKSHSYFTTGGLPPISSSWPLKVNLEKTKSLPQLSCL
jgi:hypothetical protein